jgi:hypothetical protein
MITQIAWVEIGTVCQLEEKEGFLFFRMKYNGREYSGKLNVLDGEVV